MEHLILGKKGEDLACAFLKEKAYKILERAWRHSRAEVDIIAQFKETIVFVEVKTRKDDFFGEPELAVNAHKEQMLFSAANAFIQQKGSLHQVRFDIISIIWKKPSQYRIQHFEDALFY